MTCTELYTAGDDGRLFGMATFRNSWHGAMALWSYLGDTFLGGRLPIFGSSQELWALAYRDDVPAFLRLAHLTTFDTVVVPRGYMSEVAEALRETGTTLEQAGIPNHLGEQGSTVEAMMSHGGVEYIAWNQTSVNADMWRDHLVGIEEEDGPRGYPLFHLFGFRMVVKRDGQWALADVFDRESLQTALLEVRQ